MVSAFVAGGFALCIVGSQATAPRRVVVVPATVSGDAPTTVAEKFGQATAAGVDEAGAEVVRAPEGCADESCARAAAGAHGYVLTTAVEVRGSDYAMNTRLVDASGSVVDEQSEVCEICTYEEAAQTVQSMASKAVAPVAVVAETPGVQPVRAKPVPAQKPAEEPLRDQPSRPAVMRGLGGASVAVGAAALVGGVVLLVLNERPVKNDCSGVHVDADGDCEFRYNTLGSGAGLAIGGAVALGVGVGLLVLSRGGKSRPGRKTLDVTASNGGFRLRF